MQSVPQKPFKYLREIFKDAAFRASQYKMLHKLFVSNEDHLINGHEAVKNTFLEQTLITPSLEIYTIKA